MGPFLPARPRRPPLRTPYWQEVVISTLVVAAALATGWGLSMLTIKAGYSL